MEMSKINCRLKIVVDDEISVKNPEKRKLLMYLDEREFKKVADVRYSLIKALGIPSDIWNDLMLFTDDGFVISVDQDIRVFENNEIILLKRVLKEQIVVCRGVSGKRQRNGEKTDSSQLESSRHSKEHSSSSSLSSPKRKLRKILKEKESDKLDAKTKGKKRISNPSESCNHQRTTTPEASGLVESAISVSTASTATSFPSQCSRATISDTVVVKKKSSQGDIEASNNQPVLKNQRIINGQACSRNDHGKDDIGSKNIRNNSKGNTNINTNVNMNANTTTNGLVKTVATRIDRVDRDHEQGASNNMTESTTAAARAVNEEFRPRRIGGRKYEVIGSVLLNAEKSSEIFEGKHQQNNKVDAMETYLASYQNYPIVTDRKNLLCGDSVAYRKLILCPKTYQPVLSDHYQHATVSRQDGQSSSKLALEEQSASNEEKSLTLYEWSDFGEVRLLKRPIAPLASTSALASAKKRKSNHFHFDLNISSEDQPPPSGVLFDIDELLAQRRNELKI